MNGVEWTYIYLKGVAFGMVCLLILSIPWAANLEPGGGIPSRYFWLAGLLAVAGWVGGLVWLT